MTGTPGWANSDYVDPTLLAVVRATAAGLAGKYGFSVSDGDDIGQELLVDVVVRLRKFDPVKSSRRTFVQRVVRHRVATLLDAQRAACRDFRRCRASLDAPSPFSAGDSIPLGETLSADEYEAWSGRSVLPSRERIELQIDVARVIAVLPAELAAVATVLKSAGAVEAGRRLGISRATVYRRIDRIREVFAAAGLDGYILQQRAPCCTAGTGSYSRGEYTVVASAAPQDGTGAYSRDRAVQAF